MGNTTTTAWLVAACLSVSLAGCKKNDEDKGAGGATTGEPKATEGAATKGKAGEPPADQSRKVVKVVAGEGAACALMDDGKVRCWGRNDHSERGAAASPDDAASPVEVPGVADAVDLVMGGDPGSAGDLVCATTKAGDVWCWGHARLIPGEQNNDGKPRAVADLKGAKQIVPGGGTIYALKADGTVVAWGSPAFNTFGDGNTDSWDKPITPVPGITGAKAVAAGQNHACALLGDGTVSCWGYVGPKQAAKPVAGVTGATAIVGDTAGDDTCAILGDKAVTCWGERQEPKPLEGLAGVTALTSRGHSCALTEAGEVWCWGDNTKGQLGAGTPGSSSYKPVKVEGLGKATGVAAGRQFTCAALADGGASCWGYNQRGQLGDGTLRDRAVPMLVVAVRAGTLPKVDDGLDDVQEGAATAFDGLPAACKTGALEVALDGYDGKSFPVKAAVADSQVGGKTIEITLADHGLEDKGWNPPRGKQGRIHLRLARFDLSKKDQREPVPVDLGEYTLGTEVERVVAPTFTNKLGSTMMASISLEGVDAGKLTLTHLDDAWVCGELALVADKSSIKGSFAAPIKK